MPYVHARLSQKETVALKMKRNVECVLYNEYWLPDDVWWLILSWYDVGHILLKLHGISKTWASVIEKRMRKIGFNWCYGCRVSDALLQRVPNLTRLSLFYSDRISVDGLKLFGSLTRLDITDDMGTLGEDDLLHLTNLTRLSLKGSYQIPQSNKLVALSLQENTIVSLRDILRLTALRHLKLSDPCSNIDASYLSRLTALDSLTVSMLDVCDDSFVGLTNLTRLKLLNMNRSFTDAGLSMLTNLKALTTSGMTAELTGSCLTQLPALTSLYAWHEDFPEAELSSLTTLEKLYWNKCHTSDLQNLTRLRKLCVLHTLRGDKSLLTVLPNLRKVKIAKYVSI